MRRWLTRWTSGASGTPRTLSPVEQAPASPDLLAQRFDDGLLMDDWNPDFASDPTAWERQFTTHLEPLKELLKVEPTNDAFKMVEAVGDHLSAMCNLLMMEVNSQPEASIGPILDLFFSNQIFKNVIQWAMKVPLFVVPTTQVFLLRTYEGLVNKNLSHNNCLLVHKPILLPLLTLLNWCRSTAELRGFQPSTTDKHFVLLLNQICTKIADDTTLLHFFFDKQAMNETEETEFGAQHPFLVFSLLIPYLYAPDDVGQLARDAVLLVLSVSRSLDFVADFVAYESNFCPVLATGLSGCFSQLPRYIFDTLEGREPDEFHKLNVPADVEVVPELEEFHSALLFCNAVVQGAHTEVVRQIIRYFYDGFLLEVVKEALLQTEPDELVSEVVYFHCILETVTEAPLVQALIRLLVAAETNVRDMNLLEIILDKMNSSDNLCRVVLSLLKTLLDLRCEDFMWNAIFRFILPFIPLRPTVRRRFDVNVSLKSAERFLQFVPQCTQGIDELISEEVLDDYLMEATYSVMETSEMCSTWAFKYDGSTPNNILNVSIAEEALTARQPFTRLSSARSSMASTGWNRYFRNRSQHGTSESGMFAMSSRLPLNELGEEDRQSIFLDGAVGSGSEDADSDTEVQGDLYEFNSNYENIMSRSLDYFQFAYDGISESEESNSRHNSYKGDDDEAKENVKASSKASDASAVGDTADVQRSRVISEVINTEWSAAQNLDEFAEMLRTLPIAGKLAAKKATEENVDLVHSRHQYLQELKAEFDKHAAKGEQNPFKLDLSGAHTLCNGHRPVPGGLLITCTTEKGPGLLLESLLAALDKMIDYSFATNIQLAAVLGSLASYSQPVLTTYLLYSDAVKSNALLKITKVLENLKMRIDAYASSVDGFQSMVVRGVRHKLARAGQTEKARDSFRRSDYATPRSTFRFMHRAVETQDSAADSARAKNYAYAAIVMSQLCQQLAAACLQHVAPVEFPRSKSTLGV